MSENEKPEDQKPAASIPASIQTSTAINPATAGVAVSGACGLLGAAAGAGWPGVVALALIGAMVPVSWNIIVGMFKKNTDARDLKNAGSDVGKTALDLQTQGREVSNELDQAEKAEPPTDGFPKN